MNTGMPEFGSSSNSKDDQDEKDAVNRSSRTVRPVPADVDDIPNNPDDKQKWPKYYVEEGSQSSPSKYRMEEKGLFVIMMNTRHNFNYQGADFSNIELKYEFDVKRLLKVFNLTETSENLILRKNVTPDFDKGMPTDDEISKMFTTFKANVKAYSKKPSFVFFVLMSHGFSDGSFLLSSERFCKECDNTNHALSGDCVARNADKDIIKFIQECPKFDDVPKIIMLQCCRGNKQALVKIGSKGENVTWNADDYIPRMSDTVVFHACADGSPSYVGDGSFFIQAFCEVAEETKTKLEKFERDGLQKEAFWEKNLKEYDLSPEKLVDGWIQNIFLKVSTRVSNLLVTTQETKHDKIKLCDKQQPVFTCSLRHNLSFLDMMKLENPLGHPDTLSPTN